MDDLRSGEKAFLKNGQSKKREKGEDEEILSNAHQVIKCPGCVADRWNHFFQPVAVVILASPLK